MMHIDNDLKHELAEHCQIIAARIRDLRIRRGMSQSELGKLIGLSFQQVQKYEKGRNRVSADRLSLIAKVLGVSPAFFFEGLGGMPASKAFDPDTERLVRAWWAVPPAIRGGILSTVVAVDAALRDR
ncbi:helix-turn-helix domain-containing protein [Tistrella mobilis]|uniref:helix-turn-helix domain-containing protein n=1 Tax=Tistrella mobilis TaxID=171437 RepID=UPI0035581368